MPYDLVVEDIEIVESPLENVEDNNALNAFKSTTSLDQLSISEMIQEMSQSQELNELENYSTKDTMNNVQCLPGISIVQTINKYFKNALISLLILACEFPWYVSNLYGFFTDSGCENSTLRSMSTLSFYCMWIFYLVLPFLIKIKLDRLSE